MCACPITAGDAIFNTAAPDAAFLRPKGNEMHATLEQPVTYRELDEMYGTPKTQTTRDLIIETITKTVRKVSHKVLSVPYVTYIGSTPRIGAYALVDVINDYSSYAAPLAALMAVIEKSDCPLVAEFRKQIAIRFAESHADDVEELLQ